jgi:CxxC motif-containing protein (DUF1111 family)
MALPLLIYAVFAAAGEPRPTPDAARPGGDATARRPDRAADAFSLPTGNLPAEDMPRFEAGAELFRQVWVASPAPASDEAFDGLGPLFNAKSCAVCHVRNGRGHPPRGNWPESDALSMVLRLSIPASDAELGSPRPEPTYGSQLQDIGIEGHAPEGKLHVTYEAFDALLGDGERVSLRKPVYTITHPGYGPMHPGVMISPRIASPMIGLGLLEAIPEEAILARADPDDADGDGISGRANWVRDASGAARLGRFGWKAEMATLADQTAAAFTNDIGVATPLTRRPAGDCTPAQHACLNAPHGTAPFEGTTEISAQSFDALVFHVQTLGVPERRGWRSPQALQGRRLFHETGCSSCHTPSFSTGPTAPGGAHRAHQTIWPYTDLLLHDMGEGLADKGPDHDATRRLWRTPPLWGIGRTAAVSGHTYFLHDGRARNLLEAILWHGGEAEASRRRFAALSRRDRNVLIAFLKSM